MTDKKVEEFLPCPECQAGRLHRTNVTYMTYIGAELVSVPNFPAWVCDICGRREYDNQALNQLSLLLSPNAGRSAAHKAHIAGRRDLPPKENRSVKTD